MKFYVIHEIISYKNPKFGNGHAYSDERVKEYQEFISWSAKKYMMRNNLVALDGAIKLSIVAYFKIPKSFKKSIIKLISDGDYPHIVKPDCTNIQKGVEDALKDICFKDDSSVIDIRTRKEYRKNIGQESYIDIEIIGAN